MKVLKFILNSSKPYRLQIFGIFFAICVVAIDNTLKPFLVKKLIDTVSGNASSSLWMICFLYGLLQFMLVGAWTLSDYCLVHFTSRMRLDILEHFMNKLYTFPYSFFQNQLVGSLTSKLGDAFQLTNGLIFTIVNQFTYFLLLIIISIVLLASVAPVFAVIMIVWVIFFVAYTYFSLRKNKALNKNYAEEKAKIIGHTSDYLSNILTVKMFATKNYELSKFNQMKPGFVHIAQKTGFILQKFYSVLGIFTSIYSISFIILLITGFQKGMVSPGDFALVIMTNFNIINTLFQLSHTYGEFVTNWGSVDQAISLFDEIPDIQDKPNASILKVKQGKIIFDSVKFQYKNAEPLFENKTVIIDAGQKVGLVGYSGGGKSTFVNLILRLHDVTDGQILIDGQNIKEVTQDSLRSNIAVIPQDPTLFHRTIMENIRYGCVNATDEEVIEASKGAHADEFIVQLPQGYHSLVGERGVKLSGGQRQRIAIGRAILKNAPILILDEATSQLDSLTERHIQESLWALMQGKTTIVVAHRLSTLLHMDRILVFDKGKIIQDGRHEDLLKKEGLYKKLWDTQVGGFLLDNSERIVSND